MKNIDILVFGAHPDDVELGCSGTILLQISLGYKVGVIDLTRGELGTRGSVDIRNSEAQIASEKMADLKERTEEKMSMESYLQHKEEED